jgi:hypothetical protein
MKNFIYALLCAIGLSAPAFSQQTQTTGLGFRIGSNTIATGTVCAVGADVNENPISVAISGGGMLGVGQSCPTISAGVIATGGGMYTLPDESLSQPSEFTYTFTVVDTGVGSATKGQSFQLHKVPGIAGSTFQLDRYFPTSTLITAPVFSSITGSGAVAAIAGTDYATPASVTASQTAAIAASATSASVTSVSAAASAAQTTANTAVSRTSQAVKYASALGTTAAAKGILSGASSTGDFDNATILNATLSGGNVKLVVDKPLAVNTTLLLGSNTTIECLPGDGFIEMPNTNLPLLQNATAVSSPTSCSPMTDDGVGDGGFLTSNFCQANIKIIGCYLNANNVQSITNSDHKTGLANLWITTVQMLGVKGLEFRGNILVGSPSYNVAVNNVDTFRVSENTITSSLGFGSNTDGIHMDGPVSNVFIENNEIAVGDDSVAMNADDGYKPSTGDPNGVHVAFPGWVWGAITDVTMDHNHFIGSAEGIRLLSTQSLIDHINIYNTWGTVQENALEIGPFTYSGLGNVGNVKVDGFDVASAGTLRGLSLGSTIFLRDSIKSLYLNNLTMSPATTTNPFIKLQGATVGTITVQGLNINNASGTQNVTSLIQTNAGIKNLVIDGINWVDGPGNTGAFLGGSQVPPFVTVSGFAGSHARLLATGYAPARVYGDGYIPITTYVSTTFNEGAAGAALNGTVPATTVAGAAWVNTAGGWLYQSDGGLKSDAVARSFATVNIGQSTNYAIYAKRAATAGQTGFQTIFRYLDATDYDVVNFASGAFVIVDVKAGVSRTEGSTTCGALDLGEKTAVVSVVGNYVTASVPGCSISGTMPADSTVLTATNVGFSDSTVSTNIALQSFVVANQ